MILHQKREVPAASFAQERRPGRHKRWRPSLAKGIAIIAIAAITVLPPFDFARNEARAACPPASAATMVSWSSSTTATAAQASQAKTGAAALNAAPATTAAKEEPGFFSNLWGAVKGIATLAWTGALAFLGGIWAGSNVLRKIALPAIGLAVCYLIVSKVLRLVEKAAKWMIAQAWCGIKTAFKAAKRAWKERK